MSEQKNTPWQVVKNPMRSDGWFVCYAGDDAKPCDGLPDGVPPAVIPIQLDYDTAHSIVTDHNAHDDMLAALKTTNIFLYNIMQYGALLSDQDVPKLLAVQVIISDAIAKAKGGAS